MNRIERNLKEIYPGLLAAKVDENEDLKTDSCKQN